MRILTMLFALCVLSVQAYAGKITGKVSDEKTGETVIGATVMVKGTSVGTATDIDGNFVLNVDAGTHTLVVKYIGYQTKEVDGVIIKGSETVNVNIVIAEAASTQLNEVVVRSSLKKENISALYSIQKNAATISDGISADVIRKSPDRSTGEVLKRVSGTTIQDNKYVIVRGLSDRYNTAMIDNSVLPSTEPNRKAFSFDIIPSTMIDNIIITKAATPDLPGDFAGGVINILTKETPDQNFNSISIGATYNTVSTGSQFKSGYRTSTDFLGFDDGSRQLPSGFPTTKKIQSVGLTPEENIKALNSLNNDFSIRTHSALPGVNLQGSLGRVYRTGTGNRFGFTGAVTYTHNELWKKDIIREYNDYNYRDNIYQYSTNMGGLLNAGYYFGGNKIIFKTLYNRTFDDNFLFRTGFDNSRSGAAIKYYAFDLIQKSLLKSSLEGEHQLGKGQSKLGWILSYNLITNNQPDQRKVQYSDNNNGQGYLAENTTSGKSNNRLFGSLNESIFNGGVNYNKPMTIFGAKSNFKAGVFAQYRYRDFKNRYIAATFFSADQTLRSRPIETLFAEDAMNSGSYRIEDQSLPGDAYKASTTTSAAYAMLDNKISEKLRVVWGARFESFHLDLKADDGTHVTPTWNDLLPSANFTYALTEKSNLRASYFRSLARPELREIANLSFYDYELQATFTGRPYLVRSRIDNIDLRYEIYPAPGEILSASVFYKHFDKTLENEVYNTNSSLDINPSNYPSAQNIGVEVEIRKNLGFLAKSSVLEHFNFYANLAYIHSRVELDKSTSANYSYSERALAGQSPYVINTSLGYTAFEGKLNLNVLYNRIGDRIFLVGQEKLAHFMESARNLLDFQASYDLSKRSELRFNVKDLLNSPIRIYIDQDYNGKFNDHQLNSSGFAVPNKDGIFSEYRPGSTFSLTYTYKF